MQNLIPFSAMNFALTISLLFLVFLVCILLMVMSWHENAFLWKRNQPVTCGFPSQRASYVELSWLHCYWPAWLFNKQLRCWWNEMPWHSGDGIVVLGCFLYARLKNGCNIPWQCLSLCLSFPAFFPTCFEISIWNLANIFSRWHNVSR